MNAKEFFLQVYAPWIKEEKGRILEISKAQKELGIIKNILNTIHSELDKFNNLFQDEGELLITLWEYFTTSPEFDWVTDKEIASFAGNLIRCVDRYREVLNNENTEVYQRLAELEQASLERELKRLVLDRQSETGIRAQIRKELEGESL